MNRSDKNIFLFCGNFGSGKSEIAINYAFWLTGQGLKVEIADLDLVNPYFRCREAREALEAVGIRVVAPGGEFHSSELPILLPELRGLIERPDQIAILDVGGDNIGATVLASLSDVFARADYEMYFVINMNRPFTGTVEGVIRIMREIEEASRLKITALVSNTHLIDESTVKNIVQGAEFAGEVAKAADLPLAFIGVMEQFIPKLKDYNLPYPLMPMKRHLLPPWALKKRSIGRLSTHSRDRFGQLTK